MSMLEQLPEEPKPSLGHLLEKLPEDLRRYRDLKDEIARLEKEVEPLRQQIIMEMEVMGATQKETAYRVPGFPCPDLNCIGGEDCLKTTPLKAYISPVTRESISVREAKFLMDVALQNKLIKSSESLVLRVEEDKDENS